MYDNDGSSGQGLQMSLNKCCTGRDPQPLWRGCVDGLEKRTLRYTFYCRFGNGNFLDQSACLEIRLWENQGCIPVSLQIKLLLCFELALQEEMPHCNIPPFLALAKFLRFRCKRGSLQNLILDEIPNRN